MNRSKEVFIRVVGAALFASTAFTGCAKQETQPVYTKTVLNHDNGEVARVSQEGPKVIINSRDARMRAALFAQASVDCRDAKKLEENDTQIVISVLKEDCVPTRLRINNAVKSAQQNLDIS